MPSFNRVTLIGNLTRDPQVKQLPGSATEVAEFGLAVNRRFRTQAGEDREEACFVDCTAFGRQAQTIGQYCQKGRPLLVEGRLKYDAWDDKSGGKRSKLTVVVENFQFLGRQAEEGAEDPFGHAGASGRSAQAARGGAAGHQQTFESRFAERRFREEDPFATGGSDASPSGKAGRSGSDSRQPGAVRPGADADRATESARVEDAPAERPGHAADGGNGEHAAEHAVAEDHRPTTTAERAAANPRTSAPGRSSLRGNRSPAKAGAGTGGKAGFDHEDIPF
ncbi:MAG: single-strand binding protein [Phycisphaerales bacterium]|nr:single-strand binding protein [Phycisphaerales bacterium]